MGAPRGSDKGGILGNLPILVTPWVVSSTEIPTLPPPKSPEPGGAGGGAGVPLRDHRWQPPQLTPWSPQGTRQNLPVKRG